MMNFNNFTFNKSSVPEDQNKKNDFFKDLEQQFYEEIITSKVAQEYFSQYNSNVIDSFIKSYVSKKVHLVQCYEYYERLYLEKETTDLNYQKKAENLLMAILQKKLFNLQLLWRAGKMDIDGIDMSYDFQFWGKYISSCPFIMQIAENEVEMIKEYLLLDNDVDQFDRYSSISWQDYDRIMAKDKRGLPLEMPDWYEFYDIRMGSGKLLILPNYKGAKEEFYLNLNHEEIRKKNPPKTNYQIDPKPIICGYGKDLIDFSRYFESDKYFIELFRYYDFYEEKENRDPNFDDINEAIELLFTSDRPVYFSNQLNWDKAIIDSAKRYSNTRIVESIDFVYEEYLMMKELGISKYKSKEKIKETYDKDMIVRLYRESILRGRVLNGEPADFNY